MVMDHKHVTYKFCNFSSFIYIFYWSSTCWILTRDVSMFIYSSVFYLMMLLVIQTKRVSSGWLMEMTNETKEM